MWLEVLYAKGISYASLDHLKVVKNQSPNSKDEKVLILLSPFWLIKVTYAIKRDLPGFIGRLHATSKEPKLRDRNVISF